MLFHVVFHSIYAKRRTLAIDDSWVQSTAVGDLSCWTVDSYCQEDQTLGKYANGFFAEEDVRAPTYCVFAFECGR
jgi:hypothetical protein